MTLTEPLLWEWFFNFLRIMQVKITEFGLERVAHHMDMSANLAGNTLPVVEKIVTDMLRIEGIVFSSGGRRGGGSWARLKPSTIRRKGNSTLLKTEGAKHGYSTLGNNNTLFKSLTVPGAPFQILKFTSTMIDFGTERPGAEALQHGRPDMNARPFMRFLPTDYERWGRILGDYITTPFNFGDTNG